MNTSFCKTSLKNISKVATLMAITLTLTNCTRNIQSGTYASGHVGESMNTYAGTVISKRVVEIAESEKLEENAVGGGIGGVTGGVIGNQIGRGSGNVAATLGGAVIGAVAGAMIQDHLGKQTGFEYTIQLDSGGMKTVVQGQDVNLNIGQRVLLHEAHKGRSRIVPLVQ